MSWTVSCGLRAIDLPASGARYAELDQARESNLGGGDAASWELAHPDDQSHLTCDSCGEVRRHTCDLVQKARAHLCNDHRLSATRSTCTYLECAAAVQSSNCRRQRPAVQ